MRAQLLATPELTPGPGLRETPLRGVLLTDAELDHTLGLFLLREAASLDVYATPAVLAAFEAALPARRVVDPYGQGWRWHAVDGPFELAGGLKVTPFVLGDKKPRYAAECAGQDWVVGYRLGDFVYAPCFGQWPDALDTALDGARRIWPATLACGSAIPTSTTPTPSCRTHPPGRSSRSRRRWTSCNTLRG